MAKECMPSTGKLPPGGFPRNSVFRITGHHYMTLAVYSGHSAINHTNKQTKSVVQGFLKYMSMLI